MTSYQSVRHPTTFQNGHHCVDQRWGFKTETQNSMFVPDSQLWDLRFLNRMLKFSEHPCSCSAALCLTFTQSNTLTVGAAQYNQSDRARHWLVNTRTIPISTKILFLAHRSCFNIQVCVYTCWVAWAVRCRPAGGTKPDKLVNQHSKLKAAHKCREEWCFTVGSPLQPRFQCQRKPSDSML